MKTKGSEVLVPCYNTGKAVRYQVFHVGLHKFWPRTMHALHRRGLVGQRWRLGDAIYHLTDKAVQHAQAQR